MFTLSDYSVLAMVLVVGGGESFIHCEDILQAVPLVCVMALKGGVLVLLTVLIVGFE